MGISALIRRAVGMLSAIDLNYETLLAAHEIDIIRSKRLLPHELQPAEPAIAKG